MMMNESYMPLPFHQIQRLCLHIQVGPTSKRYLRVEKRVLRFQEYLKQIKQLFFLRWPYGPYREFPIEISLQLEVI